MKNKEFKLIKDGYIFEFQALIFSFHQGSILKFFLVSKNGSAP